MIHKEKKETAGIPDNIWHRIAVISGIVAILTGVLLIANYLQYKRTDPINTTLVTTMVERLNENPADSALREEIRAIDLLVRKAYFTSKWQIKTGGYLLLAAVALMIISMQVVEYRKKTNPALVPVGEDESIFQQRKARKWIVAGGGAFLFTAMVFAFLSSNDLSDMFTWSGDEDLNNEVITGETATEVLQSESVALIEDVDADVVAGTATGSDAPAVSADNFPNFRGTAGVALKRNIPVTWNGSTGLNIKWKTAVPLPGNNSPVIWGDRVFLAGADAARQEVYCFDRNAGSLLWTAALSPGNRRPEVTAETGHAAPTAVTDGTRVYVIFATGNIAAVDMNGNKVWERDLGLPDNHYGHASSLLLAGGNIIVQYDQRNSAKIMALSAATGSTVWSTDREVAVSWASPILVNTGSRNEIILAAEPYVASYNPSSGQELWKIECVTGEVGPSLAYADGVVFSVNEYSTLSAVRVGSQPQLLWTNTEYLSDIPSPVATADYLFLATTYGILVCYDAKTGDKYWEAEIGNSVISSPMIAENRVYVLDLNGKMHIYAVDRQMRKIGEPALEGIFTATPAFTSGRIYIREEKTLYCIGE